MSLKFKSLPVFLLFSGLMHPLLAQSHRGLKVFVTFLKLNLLHWMGHWSLLSGGLAL